MGRVRVRLSGDGAPDTRRVDINAAITWNQFLEGVRHVFGWDEAKDFALSLNRREVLRQEPDSLLSGAGVCSGDLVWVLLASNDSESTAMEVDGAADSRVDEPSSTSPATVAGVGSDGPAREAEGSQVVSKVSHKGGFLPGVLRELLANLTEPLNQYLVVIATCQAALKEIGFIPVKEGPPSEERGGIYVLEYSFLKEKLIRAYNGERQGSGSASQIVNEPPRTTLRFVKMADFLMLYVTVDGNPACRQMTVDCTHHVNQKSDGSFELHNWWDLWKHFKEKIAIWVTFVIASAVGCIPELALLSLPEESKEAILAKLDFQDLIAVSQTCTDLNRIGSSDRLWGPLYVREYQKNPEEVEGGTSIKEAFRKKFSKKKRQRPPMSGNRTPVPIFMPGIPALGHPGAVGGDVDRHPFVGAHPWVGVNNAYGRGILHGHGGHIHYPLRRRGRGGDVDRFY